LCGYSDITVLLKAFYAKTEIISCYGPHFSTFGQKYLDSFTKESFKKCLPSLNEFNIVSSKIYSEDK
jgi:muramoyltetrapeptide carboxypeptidase LdcA involved in peptidoglycan recycling